jgi:tRNA(Arg) A34 adenosine deaminase TadA
MFFSLMVSFALPFYNYCIIKIIFLKIYYLKYYSDKKMVTISDIALTITKAHCIICIYKLYHIRKINVVGCSSETVGSGSFNNTLNTKSENQSGCGLFVKTKVRRRLWENI